MNKRKVKGVEKLFVPRKKLPRWVRRQYKKHPNSKNIMKELALDHEEPKRYDEKSRRCDNCKHAGPNRMSSDVLTCNITGKVVWNYLKGCEFFKPYTNYRCRDCEYKTDYGCQTPEQRRDGSGTWGPLSNSIACKRFVMKDVLVKEDKEPCTIAKLHEKMELSQKANRDDRCMRTRFRNYRTRKREYISW